MNIVTELVNGDSVMTVGSDGIIYITSTPPTNKELRAAREIVRLNGIIRALVDHIKTGQPIVVEDVTQVVDIIDVEARVL